MRHVLVVCDDNNSKMTMMSAIMVVMARWARSLWTPSHRCCLGEFLRAESCGGHAARDSVVALSVKEVVHVKKTRGKRYPCLSVIISQIFEKNVVLVHVTSILNHQVSLWIIITLGPGHGIAFDSSWDHWSTKKLGEWQLRRKLKGRALLLMSASVNWYRKILEVSLLST